MGAMLDGDVFILLCTWEVLKKFVQPSFMSHLVLDQQAVIRSNPRHPGTVGITRSFCLTGKLDAERRPFTIEGRIEKESGGYWRVMHGHLTVEESFDFLVLRGPDYEPAGTLSVTQVRMSQPV